MMRFEQVFQAATTRFSRPPRRVECFAHALRTAGELVGRSDAGRCSVPVAQIVGSVGRAQSLRHDFLPRCGPRITARHERIATAMREGQALPPVELYRLTVRASGGRPVRPPVYFVLDGHHRVAMARRLGQVDVDAHVVEYRVERRHDSNSGSGPAGYPMTGGRRHQRATTHQPHRSRRIGRAHDLVGFGATLRQHETDPPRHRVWRTHRTLATQRQTAATRPRRAQRPHRQAIS